MSTCHAQVVASSSYQKNFIFSSSRSTTSYHHGNLISLTFVCVRIRLSINLNLQQVKLLLLGPISGRVVQLFTLGTAIGRK